MFLPLHHASGYAKANFGEAMVVIGGIEQKAHFFALDLPYSDACYIRAYPAAAAEAWMDGHVHAFRFFEAVQRSILYDNDQCLVAKIEPDGTRRRARLFSEMLSRYVIQARNGRPGTGNNRGSVEGQVVIPGAISWCQSRTFQIGMPSTTGLRGSAKNDRQIGPAPFRYEPQNCGCFKIKQRCGG